MRARDTLRLEVCYPLHGNDIGPQWDAISGGLRFACALETDFTGVEVLREVASRGPARRLVAFTMTEQAIPRQGMAIAGGGEVTSGSLSPMLELGHRAGLRALGAVGRRHRDHHRCARTAARRQGGGKTDLPTRGVNVATGETYPDELLYNADHDWARIEGDQAVLGVTWFALDSLGELVHFEPPAVGQAISAGDAYGEVESVKAVSDLISPLSGTVSEVNAAVVDDPLTVNDDPYGAGWLVRSRWPTPPRPPHCSRPSDYRASLTRPVS